MHGVNSRPVNRYGAAVLSLGIGNPAKKLTRIKMASGFMLQRLCLGDHVSSRISFSNSHDKKEVG